MKKYLYLCVSLSSSSLIDSNATPGGRRPPLQQHIDLKCVCLSMCYVIMRLYWRSVVGAVSLLLLTGRGERWTHSCESYSKNTKCLTCFLLDLLRQNVEFVCLILRDLLSFSRHTTFWEINNVLKRTAEVKCTFKLTVHSLGSIYMFQQPLKVYKAIRQFSWNSDDSAVILSPRDLQIVSLWAQWAPVPHK